MNRCQPVLVDPVADGVADSGGARPETQQWRGG